MIFLIPGNLPVDHILIKPPHSSNPNSRYQSLIGIFADSYFMEFQISEYFFGGHDLAHSRILRWNVGACYLCVLDVNLMILYIPLKFIRIKQK